MVFGGCDLSGRARVQSCRRANSHPFLPHSPPPRLAPSLPPPTLCITLKLHSRSSYHATGDAKSRGLARQLEPGGQRGDKQRAVTTHTKTLAGDVCTSRAVNTHTKTLQPASATI